jgi:hypothetical protein
MGINDPEKTHNILALEGAIYKTNGNILFEDAEDRPFYLAESTLLDKMDDVLENGIQTFLKKLKD